MVGGPDFNTTPFNLATQGHRQPGSSIKPFTLITALEQGISPYTVYPSEERFFYFGKNHKEVFQVTNDENSYLGSCDIVCATTYSDNSIYAALALEGLKGEHVHEKTGAIAGTIHKAGYDDPISTNPAMVLGGLAEGVTPLGWAYAYSTIGNNYALHDQVVDQENVETAKGILETVVSGGTGTNAQIGAEGFLSKTATTE